MRILYIGGARDMQNPGGIETYGRELMRAMAHRGHAVECLGTAPDTVMTDVRWRDYWPTAQFRQRYYVRRRFAHEDYRYHMALRRRAASFAATFKPDIIHSLHVYLFGAVVDCRQPVVVSAYGLEVDAIPPVLGSVRTARVVHAISHFTADLVRSRTAAREIEVLTWGIRPPVAPVVPECDFDLITVSRLVRRKNVDSVLRAIRKLGDLRYAIVGDGPERAALQELARSLGLTRVSFFGAVPDERRRELLARSRLFVMCPRHEEGDVEGLGLVYFEAFEQGLPVVASDKGGVPDAVGSAGLLIDDGEDVEKLSQAIRTALDDHHYADLQLRVAERQRSQSWDHFLDGFEALYDRVS